MGGFSFLVIEGLVCLWMRVCESLGRAAPATFLSDRRWSNGLAPKRTQTLSRELTGVKGKRRNRPYFLAPVVEITPSGAEAEDEAVGRSEKRLRTAPTPFRRATRRVYSGCTVRLG